MNTTALSVSNDNPLCRRLGVNRSRPLPLWTTTQNDARVTLISR
jgi:hypothetical protein